ncbi:MAG: hypothetical protein HQL84_00825 [Magnetococcales bacterium]|nr:hypothetical protein [Magnetococcales bacterium]MBF0148572.1 hypothetical protein [Magnetococcales bacterium]MBF0172298.1 hypothetical protein [Magnetococcales bacterium]MBF0347301.1 hypothetical protein [Magnetococcales bacterium]MBF0629735.1 hypothetical protein [Magnetococcales bacterium]
MGCDANAGEMDRRVAQGLGIPVAEYVDALLKGRVRVERWERGTVVDGVTLLFPRAIFHYQGRWTQLDLGG